jgi:signal transduction histidine kinase
LDGDPKKHGMPFAESGSKMSFYPKRWSHTKGFYVGLCLVLITLFVGIDGFFNYRHVKSFVLSEESEAESDFSRHAAALQEISDLIYTTVINTDEVRTLYKDAYGDGEKRDEVRQKLWDMLKDDYKILHKFRIQQLHFQLPNNESFLRFHKPEKFGDSLVGIRPTIEYVNRFHKPISGFEEGRIFNGFRYVYPLFDHDNNYIGSVEISSSALSYKEAYELDQKQELDIVMRADVVEEKVFKSQQSNYIPYRLNSDFRVERSIDKYDHQKRAFHEHNGCLDYFGKRTDVIEKMGRMEKFSAYGIYKGRFVLATFLPLKNAITKEKVAYAIIFRESEYLANTFRGFIFESILAVLAALMLTVAYYFVHLRFMAKRQLEEALVSVQEASKAKDTFLSSMSHELRTPLNAIIGFSQILMVKPDTPETIKGVIEKIHISGKNLLTLVNTILDFSKIESGKMDLFIDPFEMQALIDEVKILVEPMAEKKQIALLLDLKEPLIIKADRQLIKQVILNLLSNAIKFSPQSTAIVLEYMKEEQFHCFAIRDQGVGIDHDQIATLFDPFTQIREHQNESIKGTGLGLAIVKKIIELHHGKIWIESVPGEGSTFFIALPKLEIQLKSKLQENVDA